MISPEPVKINDEMVELYYDFNIMENNKSYYTTTYKNTFFVFDTATEKIINQYQIFTLPAWQYYGETLLSPNGFSFAVLVRDEIIDGRTTHDPPLKYFIFDTRLESSYSWTIDIKEEFGTWKKEYQSPYNIERLTDDLLLEIDCDLNDGELRQKLQKWLLFLNDATTENTSSLTKWVLPLKGSLLYMLGMKDLSFSVDMKILK
jgi:hypothetical protein